MVNSEFGKLWVDKYGVNKGLANLAKEFRGYLCKKKILEKNYVELHYRFEWIFNTS